MKEKNIQELAIRMGLITVEDMCQYTIAQLVVMVANKVNELIDEVGRFESDVVEIVKTQNENIQYLLGEGLHLEVESIFDVWIKDGTFDTLINQTALKQINKRLDDLEIKPFGDMELQRIGRKLVVGEHTKSTNHNPEGKACMLQGGCVIDENTVAYVLWDNLNNNLNKNTLVIMNINTGVIIREKEFNFGWCNSISFNDNKIYIAERGRTNNNISSNNGIIHVIDYGTLDEISHLNLPINANAISIHENVLYVLEENQNIIHKYELDGTAKNENIDLGVTINDLYNQNILVTSDFIYLLSSKPSNFLHIYDLTGKLIRCYNIPIYGGMYYVGEPQFIAPLTNGDMILGSVAMYFNECVNQFFKFNLLTGVNNNFPNVDYALTLSVNSDVDYYNPNGEQGNEFTSINECGGLAHRNVILNCNNKSYKHTRITDARKYVRVMNAILSEGMYAQYGHVDFTSCQFKKSINTSTDGCLHIRDLKTTIRDCSFDGGGSKYCINAERHNTMKITTPTFSNYTDDAIGNMSVGNSIDFNSYDNLPYVRHSNVTKFNLHTKGYIQEYEPGTYNYNTDLTPSQIQRIMDNCNRVRVAFKSFNNSSKVVEFVKNSSHEYSFCESTMSTSTVNVRFCKTQIRLTNKGVTITSNHTTQFRNDAWTVLDATTSKYPDEFNSIRAIEFVLL